MIGVWSPELLAAINQNQSEWRIESAEVVLHFHLSSLNWSESCKSYAGHAMNSKVWCEVEQGHGGWPRLQRHGWSQEVGHHP